MALNCAVAATHGESFVVTGGHNGRDFDSIYEYNPDTGGWTLLPKRLPFAASCHAAFPVDREQFAKIE